MQLAPITGIVTGVELQSQWYTTQRNVVDESLDH